MIILLQTDDFMMGKVMSEVGLFISIESLVKVNGLIKSINSAACDDFLNYRFLSLSFKMSELTLSRHEIYNPCLISLTASSDSSRQR